MQGQALDDEQEVMKIKGKRKRCLAIIVFFNYKKQRDNYTAIIELQKLD